MIDVTEVLRTSVGVLTFRQKQWKNPCAAHGTRVRRAMEKTRCPIYQKERKDEATAKEKNVNGQAHDSPFPGGKGRAGYVGYVGYVFRGEDIVLEVAKCLARYIVLPKKDVARRSSVN